MHSTDIVGYTFKADTYCPGCVVAQVLNGGQAAPDIPAEDALDALAAERSIDRYDEATYDSGDFPKVIFADQATDDDVCGGCGNKLR